MRFDTDFKRQQRFAHACVSIDGIAAMQKRRPSNRSQPAAHLYAVQRCSTLAAWPDDQSNNVSDQTASETALESLTERVTTVSTFHLPLAYCIVLKHDAATAYKEVRK